VRRFFNTLLIASILLVSLPSLLYAGPASDYQHHWAVETLQKWVDRGWLKGYDNGELRPNAFVTRAEFIAFINRAFELGESADIPPLTDGMDKHWAYKDIAIAEASGYLRNQIDHVALADAALTRQEVAYMIDSLLDLKLTGMNDVPQYSDRSDIDSWAADAVTNLYQHRIMTGDPSGKFRPQHALSRAEAVTVIDSAIQYKLVLEQQSTDQESIRALTRLTVSSNHRFITQSDGTPFFWLGDTVWELIHRANRNEVTTYMKNASDNGINVIQTVILAELSGLTTPNAYGDLPLTDKDPEQPLTTAGSNPTSEQEYDYWDHVDYIIETAEAHGIYVALLPTWGSYLWFNQGQFADPIFDESNAYSYGEWLGKRYGDRDHIVWILGGDRIPDTDEKKEIIRNLAEGLDNGGGTQLKTYHPWGGKSSSEYFHNEDWLDFNSFQSGHAYREYPNYNFAYSDYERYPIKPTFDIEPRYEHLPINFNLDNGRFDANEARHAAYWSVFAGSFGHTYGHNSIWQLYHPQRASALHAATSWTSALHADGRTTLKWLRSLIESRPMLDRVPDQSLVTKELEDGNRITGTRGNDYAFIYSSKGYAFTVNLGKITGDFITAYWYNPRTGEASLIGEYANQGNRSFSPPSNGSGNDWVLILDDSSKGYTL
jgi:hypothetical protein